MAGVGATLFGLIFLAVSIRPESTIAASATIRRQAQVASAYTSLLNPLVISLMALIPHVSIGIVTLVMSLIALVNTFIMTPLLLRGPYSRAEGVRRVIFSLGAFVIFGFELYYAIWLMVSPRDRDALSTLAYLLVIVYLHGVASAWNLLETRQFQLRDLLLMFTGHDTATRAAPTEAAKQPTQERDSAS